MSKVSLPDANAPWVSKETGRPTEAFKRWAERLVKQGSGSEDGLAGLPAKFQTEFGSWVIEYPDNKDYRLVINVPYGFTISTVTTRSTTGTCTATVKINSTALGGSTNSVSTSEQTRTHTSANVMEVGDDLVLTISSNSSCENLTITIAGTRILA